MVEVWFELAKILCVFCSWFGCLEVVCMLLANFYGILFVLIPSTAWLAYLEWMRTGGERTIYLS